MKKELNPKKDILNTAFRETKKDRMVIPNIIAEQGRNPSCTKKMVMKWHSYGKGTTGKKDNIPDYRFVETKKT